VASLLDLSRQTGSYTEYIDLNKVVTDAIRILDTQFKHQPIELETQFAEDLPMVNGNFANLGQVALNLIKNAIQAIDEHAGRVSIKTCYLKGEARIMFACRDSGPGVPDDLCQDIFKPFFTTKPVGQGTGLGLYICHEIVSRHGGTLELKKYDGKWCRFVVCLPVNN